MTGRSFDRLPGIVLLVHVVLAVGFVTSAFLTTGDSDGWSDLALVAAGMLAGTHLIGVGIGWLATRVLRGVAVRTVAAAVIPAVVTVAVVLTIRG